MVPNAYNTHELVELIRKDQIKQVLAIMSDPRHSFPKNLMDEASLLSARSERLEYKIRQGIIATHAAQLEANQIRTATLDLIESYRHMQMEELKPRFLQRQIQKRIGLVLYLLIFSGVVWWLFQEPKNVAFQGEILADKFTFRYLEGPTGLGQHLFDFCTWQNFEQMSIEGRSVKVDEHLDYNWGSPAVLLSGKLALKADLDIPNIGIQFGPARLESLFLDSHSLISIEMNREEVNAFQLSIQQSSPLLSHWIYLDSLLVETEQITIEGLRNYTTSDGPIRMRAFASLRTADEMTVSSYTGNTNLYLEVKDSLTMEVSALLIESPTFLRSIETTAVSSILGGQISITETGKEPLIGAEITEGEMLEIRSVYPIEITKMIISHEGIRLRLSGKIERIELGKDHKSLKPDRITWLWYDQPILFLIYLTALLLISIFWFKFFGISDK